MLTMALPEECYNVQFQVGSLWSLPYIGPINEYKTLNRQKNTVTCWYVRGPSFMEPVKVYKGILAIKLITICNVENFNAKICEVT